MSTEAAATRASFAWLLAKRFGRVFLSRATVPKFAMLRATWEARTGAKGPCADRTVPLGMSTVVLAKETFEVDYRTLYGQIIDDQFSSDFNGAIVLDIGAHKGYYGAKALSRGAARVISFEPSSQNFGYLEMAVKSSALAIDRWEARRQAVGPASGEMLLSLSDGSWGHSLLTPATGVVVGTEIVSAVTLGGILDDLESGAPIIVKINIEGMAGAVVVATSDECWKRVREVWLDIEPNDPVSERDIVEHLGTSGLAPAKRSGTLMSFVRVQ